MVHRVAGLTALDQRRRQLDELDSFTPRTGLQRTNRNGRGRARWWSAKRHGEGIDVLGKSKFRFGGVCGQRRWGRSEEEGRRSIDETMEKRRAFLKGECTVYTHGSLLSMLPRPAHKPGCAC
jgi:hypothetical protein